jgi:hypothetical protein
MTMRTGQLWECRNGACGCEILVVAKSGVKSRFEPRCSCGSVMQKSPLRQAAGPRSAGFPSGFHGGGMGPRAHGPMSGALAKAPHRPLFPK